MASRTVRVLFATVALGFCAYALADQWNAVYAAAARLSWYVVVGSLLAALGALACMLMTWRALLADLGSPLAPRPAARVLFLGQLGKYVPGSVWPLVAQMELAREHHVPRWRSLTANALWMFFNLTGALVAAAVTLPLVSASSAGKFWPALAIAPLLIVFLHPAVLNRMLDRLLPLARQPPPEQPLSLSGTARAFGWALAVWALLGLQAWLLVGGVGAKGPSVPVVAVGAFALASAVGFLVVIAPAGVGPREAALVAALAPVLPAGDALVVALVSRVVMTVADLVWAGVAVLLARHRPPLREEVTPPSDPRREAEPVREPRGRADGAVPGP